jgi:hypothetical protein
MTRAAYLIALRVMLCGYTQTLIFGKCSSYRARQLLAA